MSICGWDHFGQEERSHETGLVPLKAVRKFNEKQIQQFLLDLQVYADKCFTDHNQVIPSDVVFWRYPVPTTWGANRVPVLFGINIIHFCADAVCP